MDDCCEDKASELAVIQARHERVLWVVLIVNALMFFVEFGAGILSGSSALLADSLDMLGDALVYGVSLAVVARSLVWRARASLLKGLVMAAFGIGVLFEVAFKLDASQPPLAPAMAGIAGLAFVANGLCFSLLWRYRADDINLRSTWLCSRNDLIANASVVAAAVIVAWSGSRWPDILVGLGIALLFLRTAAMVIRESVAAADRAESNASETTA